MALPDGCFSLLLSETALSCAYVCAWAQVADTPETTSSLPDQPKAMPLSHAVVADRPPPVKDFFAHHEGVHLFSWEPERHGYGVMDRYLEGVLRCTHLAAALSQCKVLLFPPSPRAVFAFFLFVLHSSLASQF